MIGKTWLGCKVQEVRPLLQAAGPGWCADDDRLRHEQDPETDDPNGVGTFQNLAGQVIGVVPGQKVKVNGNPVLLLGV